MSRDDWDSILTPGEEILWQGSPGTGVLWSDLSSPQSRAGIPFTAFAVIWTLIAVSIVPRDAGLFSLLFPLWGLMFVAIGLYLFVGRLFVDAWRRRRQFYTLTNKAAYIGDTSLGWRRLHRYPLTREQPIELISESPGTIWFSEVPGMRVNKRPTRKKVGFVQIPDAPRVFALMTSLKDRKEPAP